MLQGILVQPHILYGITLWQSTFQPYTKKNILLHEKGVRLINKYESNVHSTEYFVVEANVLIENG